MKDFIHFYINDQECQVRGDKAFLSLSDFLRYELGLVGTKVVCAEGDCGACTVLIQKPLGRSGLYQATNSCILSVALLDGTHIVTVEGLKSQNELHPVQQSMVENFASQCGFCTPGFVCAMTALAEEARLDQFAVNEKKARNYLTGNLCRCTGYDSILQAAQKINLTKMKLLKDRYLLGQKFVRDFQAQSVLIQGSQKELFLPLTLSEALQYKKQKNVRILAGGTDLGVLYNKGKWAPEALMSLYHIKELHEIQKTSQAFVVGACVSLTDWEEKLKKENLEFKRLMRIFASPQIKNQATLAGNVLNASPIGDTIPALMALGASVQLQSQQGIREVLLEKFYLDYKKIDLKEDEIAIGLQIPFLPADEKFKSYKVSLRRDLDISAVTLACKVKIQARVVKDITICMGGVGPVVKRLWDLEKKWLGQKWDADVLKSFQIQDHIQPLSDVRGSREFRLQVSQRLFTRLVREMGAEL